MRKKNFHLTLIILFTIAVLGILKYLLPSDAPTSVNGRRGKQAGNNWDMGSSSNSISFFPSEGSYGTMEDSDYEAIAIDNSTSAPSINSSNGGSSGFLSNSNVHANRFEENLYQESNTSNSMSGNAVGSSDGGVGIAMVSVSMPITNSEKKEKDEKSEKGDPANSKTTVAGKPSFFSGNDQIMATPPLPPPTPTEAPLDDYYPLIAIAGAIFGTMKLLCKPKAIIA